MKDIAIKSATSEICQPLWASLRNVAVQSGLTTHIDRNQKKWSPEPTLKNEADSEKPNE